MTPTLQAVQEKVLHLLVEKGFPTMERALDGDEVSEGAIQIAKTLLAAALSEKVKETAPVVIQLGAIPRPAIASLPPTPQSKSEGALEPGVESVQLRIVERS